MSATEVDGWDGEWVAPPRRGNFVWPDRLEPLRSNPGEWAKFGPFSFMGTGKQVGYINRGRYGDGFIACRKSDNGRDWIYVKFDPEELSDAC